MQIISACGILCNECNFFGKECSGCNQVEGKPFWTSEYKIEVCPLYNCSVNDKNFKNCGECAELPCKTLRGMKDPNSTQEEHEKSIIERVNRLKN
jgi:hypothetical protein